MINTIIFFAQNAPQTLTTLEVIDTAVKVGLGAIISGLATYFVTRLQQKGLIEQEQRKRKAEIVQGVAEQIENINHAYLKYAALTRSALLRIENGVEWTEAQRGEREQVKTELFNSYRDLTNAEAKMMLIGEVRASELVREYGEKITKFRQIVAIKEQHPSDNEIEILKTDILNTRKQLFAALSTIYKHT